MLLAGVAIVIWTVSKIESSLFHLACISIVETQRRLNTPTLSTLNKQADSVSVFKVASSTLDTSMAGCQRHARGALISGLNSWRTAAVCGPQSMRQPIHTQRS